MKLPNKTVVVVADGARQLFLVNEGDEGIPNLRRLDEAGNKSPLTHDQGDDRPGRVPSVASRRGAPEDEDLHERDESRFSKALGESLKKIARQAAAPHIVLVCDPGTLGEVRKHYDGAIRKALLAEIPKDLTGHTVPDIESVLADWS